MSSHSSIPTYGYPGTGLTAATLATTTTTQLPTSHLGPSATTATYEIPPAPQNLVHLAREILKSTGREGRVSVRAAADVEMSAGDEQAVAVAVAESPSSRFTAVNEKEQPTIVVSMNGQSSNGAPSRSSPSDERAKAQAMMPPPPRRSSPSPLQQRLPRGKSGYHSPTASAHNTTIRRPHIQIQTRHTSERDLRILN